MPAYKKVTNNLEHVTILNPLHKTKLDWVNVYNAERAEIEYLRKKYKFELHHLKASLGRTMSQRPLVEQGNGYLFVILHFPVYFGNSIIAGEIDFFIGKDFLVTLHNNNIPTLNEFFNFCKKEPKCLFSFEHETSVVLLYQLLERLMLACFPILDQNSIQIANTEVMIFSQDKPKDTVSQILQLRRNIVNLRKIMQNHKNILKKLIEVEYALISESAMKHYFRNLIDHSKRIWENIENQKDMIEIFNDSNESMTSNRMGEVMKTLTIFSVLTFPLTLFATIFSMNMTDGMPFLNTPNNFWIVFQFILVIGLSMLLFFERKKWL